MSETLTRNNENGWLFSKEERKWQYSDVMFVIIFMMKKKKG
jgi:hypothetical protein